MMLKRLFCTALPAAGLAAMLVAATPAARAADDPETLYATLAKAEAVVEGAQSPRRVLYVFFDANCWYCHLAWKALQSYERAGLQVRWVPVAYQKESSIGRAAAIMGADDRAAALRANEEGYRRESYDGGIAPAHRVSGDLVAQLASNTRLMQRFGARGTPALVWRDDAGRVRVKVGMPHLAQLPEITGLAAQPNDDPALDRFR